ncbi:MAG: O-antigen ligase family protein [Bacteroidota bacterium]
MSFYVALLGMVIFVFNLLFGQFTPIKSIMLEPAHFATVMLPAFYYSKKNKHFPKYVWKVLLVAILLSGSSLGLLGLGVAILLLSELRLVNLLYWTSVVLCLFYITYLNYVPLNKRIKDTYNAIKNKSLEDINVSSFVLVSNYFVALDGFSQNPIFGSGLGSHELSHEKFVYSISGVNKSIYLVHINEKDAASLLLRIISELGILGLIVLSYVLVKYCTNYKEGEPAIWISRAVLVYIFCKLLRDGHYFPPELYFFVFSYIFAYRQARIKKDYLIKSVDAQ